MSSITERGTAMLTVPTAQGLMSCISSYTNVTNLLPVASFPPCIQATSSALVTRSPSVSERRVLFKDEASGFEFTVYSSTMESTVWQAAPGGMTLCAGRFEPLV